MAYAIFVTLCLALAAPAALLLSTKRLDRLSWAATGYACLTFELLLWHAASWSSLSEHVRHPLLAFAVGSVAWSFRRTQKSNSGLPPSRSLWSWLGLSLLLGCGTMFAAILVDVWRGSAQREPSVSLAWPLTRAKTYVMQGGATTILNHHADISGQRRALDVVALDGLGRRSARPFASDPALVDYLIYGAEVRSPCSGQIVALRSDQPDRPIGSAPLARKLAGSYALVYCPAVDCTVLLAHLQQRPAVSVGEAVEVGTLIGRVGNSGNSTEPHLHIHAVPGRIERADEMIGSKVQGIAMRFDERGPLRRGDSGPRVID